MEFKISTNVVGMVGTNCYFLINEDTNEAIIFDPGDKGLQLMEALDRAMIKPVMILLTHGHFDHILAANQLKEKYNIPIGAGAEEVDLLLNPDTNLTVYENKVVVINPDKTFENNDIFEAAGFTIKVLHTPGHTKGSVSYYLEDEKVLFSGDTLFYGSVGRTDFPTGSMKDILYSVNKVLMKLPDDVDVYPGHSFATTIGQEKQINPYVE